MALQASGTPISASQIRSEFGATSGTSVSFGSYRVKQTISGLTDMPLDAGIPNSVAIGNSSIKYSDFYSKRLNVVVDETPSTGTATRVNGKSDYDANNSKVKVIGNFRTRPASPAGTKVWIHTNGPIGSNVPASSASQTYCSLLTGSWDATTDLIVDIGPSGSVYGAGGNGGNGRSYGADPTVGGHGTSAVGVNVTNNITLNIQTGGAIIAGGGGGGGGGGALQTSGGRQSNGVGGGGGGGNGFPAGSGGQHGGSSGTNGNGGNLTTGGDGGTGGVDGQTSGGGAIGGGGGGGAFGGKGGSGGYNGGWNISGDNGTDASTTGGSGGAGTWTGANRGNVIVQGAVGGTNGYAIVVNSPSVRITNNGTITGNTAYNTAPD